MTPIHTDKKLTQFGISPLNKNRNVSTKIATCICPLHKLRYFFITKCLVFLYCWIAVSFTNKPTSPFVFFRVKIVDKKRKLVSEVTSKVDNLKGSSLKMTELKLLKHCQSTFYNGKFKFSCSVKILFCWMFSI